MVERILLGPGGATEVKQDTTLATLDAILTELQQKLEAGQTVALDAGTLAALESITASVTGTVTAEDSGERGYTHVVATVNSPGNTTVYTPAAGKAIRLRWIYAINDPTAATSPLIRVSLGATEIYRVYALSKRQLVLGDVDAPLIINLSAAGSVAVTVLLEEV